MTLCTPLSFKTITQNKGKRAERDPQKRNHALTDCPKSLDDLPAHGVAASTIKEKKMAQAAILSEQVFLRAGTFFKLENKICKCSSIKY